MKQIGVDRDKQSEIVATSDGGGEENPRCERKGRSERAEIKKIKSEDVCDKTSTVEAVKRMNRSTGMTTIGKISAAMDSICERGLDAFDKIDVRGRIGGPNRGGILKKVANIG